MAHVTNIILCMLGPPQYDLPTLPFYDWTAEACSPSRSSPAEFSWVRAADTERLRATAPIPGRVCRSWRRGRLPVQTSRGKQSVIRLKVPCSSAGAGATAARAARRSRLWSGCS